MYKRVVPGLPVMMALGNALSDAAKKQAHTKSSQAQPPAGAADIGRPKELRPQAHTIAGFESGTACVLAAAAVVNLVAIADVGLGLRTKSPDG